VRASFGSSASAKIVLKISTPVTSLLIGPPAASWCAFVLVVRSGLIVSHVIPPSRVRCTCCEAW
jgi:hypothetical protein